MELVLRGQRGTLVTPKEMTMFRAALFLALLLAALPGAAAAECPTNAMYAMYGTQVSTNYAGNFSQSSTCSADGRVVTASGAASYNLAIGRIGVSVASGGAACSAGAGILTHDTFTLTGPASGSPITFRAQLDVEFHLGGQGGPGWARIREGDSNASPSSDLALYSTVGITITRTPG